MSMSFIGATGRSACPDHDDTFSPFPLDVRLLFFNRIVNGFVLLPIGDTFFYSNGHIFTWTIFLLTTFIFLNYFCLFPCRAIMSGSSPAPNENSTWLSEPESFRPKGNGFRSLTTTAK